MHLRFATGILLVSATTAFSQTKPLKPDVPQIPSPQSLTLSSTQAHSYTLTVDQAVSLAFRSQPNLLISRDEYLAAKAKLQQTAAASRPQFSITGNDSDFSVIRRGSFATGASGTSTQGAFNASILLFDFGRTRDLIRQQESLVDIASDSSIGVELTVESNVRSAFHAFEQSQAFLVAAQSNLANRKSQLDLANARLSAGTGAPSDLVQAQTAVADATISLVSAQASLLNSRLLLANAIGIDARSDITTADSVTAISAKSLDDWTTEGLNQRWEIRAAKHQLEASTSAASAARKLNAPQVNLSGTVTTRGVSDPLNTQTGSVGVFVSWPFSDGGLGKARSEEAKANLRVAESQFTQTKLTVINDVATAYIALEGAEQRIAVAQAQLTNARELVRIAEGRYRGGIGNFLDVTSAQDNLYNADRNVAQAIGDYKRAQVALLHATGAKSVVSK